MTVLVATYHSGGTIMVHSSCLKEAPQMRHRHKFQFLTQPHLVV
jgi:hypothetical protein